MTLARLPVSGTFSYNTVVFNPTVRTIVRGVPRLDEAGRVVKWIEYTVELSGYVAASDSGAATTDALLTSYRQKLLAVGGSLALQTKGFGDLTLNGIGGTTRRDALWGPLPELLLWKPLGDKLGAYVEWRCKVHVACERSGSLNIQAPLAVNYEWQHEVDQDGYSVQRITGHLEIPMSKLTVDNPTVEDTADRYRERIKPEVPPGFQRVRQSFRLSKNKNRLDFTFEDREVTHPLPDSMTGADVEHEVETDSSRAFFQWTSTISGSLTVARGAPKALAWEKFLIIVADRLGIGARLPAAANIPARQRRDRAQRRNVGLFLKRVSFRDQVFGRGASFSVTYWIMGVPIKDILAVSGLWEPVAGAQYATWKTSLLNSAWHERGFIKLKHSHDDDVLVDLCLDRPARIGPSGRGLSPPFNVSITAPPPGGGGTVPPESSWLIYRQRLRISEDHRRVPHKPLTLPPIERAPGAGTTGSDEFFIGIERDSQGAVEASTPRSTPAGNAGSTADVIQTVSSPSFRLVLSGEGVRAGHRVPCPALRTVGGIVPVLAFRDYVEGQMGAAGGIPIFGAAWLLEYLLPMAPSGNLPVAGNPALGTRSSNGD